VIATSVTKETETDDVHTLLRYIDFPSRKKPTLRAILRRVISEEKRRMYISVYDEVRAEGKAEGKLELLVAIGEVIA
jgi:predicted nucleic acid-binding OB-fold protein